MGAPARPHTYSAYPRTALATASGRRAGRLGRSGPAQTGIHGPKAREAPAFRLTVDQGNACPALTTTEAEVKIMPDPEFTLAPGTNGLVVIGPGDCRHYGL